MIATDGLPKSLATNSFTIQNLKFVLKSLQGRGKPPHATTVARLPVNPSNALAQLFAKSKMVLLLDGSTNLGFAPKCPITNTPISCGVKN
ncbi:hypothetical protein NIES4103_39300 [Nostoc sp. NIES-4103]|nr:hypothetical protein NIES4103_39300 [Nostoc sp. NIES-4103]